MISNMNVVTFTPHRLQRRLTLALNKWRRTDAVAGLTTYAFSVAIDPSALNHVAVVEREGGTDDVSPDDNG